MRRAAPLLLLLAVAGTLPAADDVGPLLRALKAEERERRREALVALAEGRVRPESRRDAERMESALLRFLPDRVPGAERALAVAGLARLDRPSASLALAGMAPGERDDRVLDALADAFRTAAPEATLALLRSLDAEKDPLGRAVLLRLLGMTMELEARERLLQRAASEIDPVPRAAAALALGGVRRPESFPPLLALLDSDDPLLASAAIESLARLTGLRHGPDVPAWKAWWSTRGKEAPPAEPAAPEPEPEAGRKPDAHHYAHERAPEDPIGPYYFGIPVRGREVVFLYDVSASMRYKMPLANDQLTRAIRGLASHVRFEVIFFNEFVWPWRGRLSRADPVTKELLVRHLPTIEIKSYTNLFDSLETAFGMDPDEIFVISDGEPNRGRRRLPRDILNETDKLNARHIPVHTVSVVRVVDGDDHLPFLKELAERNGGEHVERTLK